MYIKTGHLEQIYYFVIPFKVLKKKSESKQNNAYLITMNRI